MAPLEFASRSRIVFELASGLAKKGHQVSLLGTGDSIIPNVKIIPVIEKAWVSLPPSENSFMRDIATLALLTQKLKEIENEFDIIHNHVMPDIFPHIIEKELHTPLVSTLHAVFDDYLDTLLSTFHRSYFVALSDGYRELFKKTNIPFVVYNGVDTNLYRYQAKKEDYLLWIGRINNAKNSDGTYIDPKGVRGAIALAEKSGEKLFLLGSVHDKEAFKVDVVPHLSEKIQWVGNIDKEQSVSTEKVIELMQGAKAFLVTINQEEPFGLTMAEAGSCGTPVIAFDRGSVKEIIIDGKTGFVVPPEKGIAGLEKALFAIDTISSIACRRNVEEKFSLESMVLSYENLYAKIVEGYH